MSGWSSILTLVAMTSASVMGSVLLKHAAASSNLAMAAAGTALWAATAVGFLKLAASGHDLGWLSIITSCLAILFANLLGVALFGEDITREKLIAFALLSIAMLLLS